MLSGCVYGPQTLGHRTSENGGSVSPGLLPTPAAGNFNDGESLESWEARRRENLGKGINGNGQGTPLGVAVRLLKTPTAQLAVNGGSQHPDKRREGGHGPTLADQVEHTLLPTPRAADGNGNGRAAMGRQGSRSLTDALLPTPRATRGGSGTETMYAMGGQRDDTNRPQGEVLLPTPSVADVTGGHRCRSGNRRDELLLPGIAETLTGGSTSQLSAAGKPSLGGQRHAQLSLDEPESG